MFVRFFIVFLSRTIIMHASSFSKFSRMTKIGLHSYNSTWNIAKYKYADGDGKSADEYLSREETGSKRDENVYL